MVLRQLDGGPAAFDSLQIMADAVAGKFRSSLTAVCASRQHVFKTIASGADLKWRLDVQ